MFESQDGSNIILDLNSNNLNCPQVISNTNKVSSDFVNVNGISLTNCFSFYKPLINNCNNNKSINLMNGVNLRNITVANSTTTYDIPGNSTIYSNGIVKIKQ